MSSIANHIEDAARHLAQLATPAYLNAVERAAAMMREALAGGNKLLIFGNGGSAADAQHIAAEFVGRYVAERPAIAAIALTVDSSALTAWANDYAYDTVFARQIEALGKPGDVAWGITTSGNSKNVLLGLEQAGRMGLRTLAMVGRDGGNAAAMADVAVTAPFQKTAHIQEAHLVTYHALCGALDDSSLANWRPNTGNA